MIAMSIGVKKVVAVFESYSDAESAVEDLEVELGLSGGEVVLIPGADTDARTVGYIERSRKPLHDGERFSDKVADALHLHKKEPPAAESSWVRVDGQPKMPVGDDLDTQDAEFTDRDPALAGPTVVTVRLVNDKLAEEASGILKNNGAVDLFQEVESAAGGATADRPETSPAPSIATLEAEMGTGKATTGADDTDLQGRGQKFKTQSSPKD
jgi:hypothetical protein